VELGPVRLKDIDEPERVVQLEIDGLPASFPPLRAETEEPMDFGERLSRKIKADVERRLELSLSGDEPEVADTKQLSKLILVGMIPFVVLVASIVVIVLLVKSVV
jgi:hypothetical protein